MKTLVIFSHPHLATSRVHRTLIDTIDDLPDVHIHHLEAMYPQGDIDVEAEQSACEHASRLVFQFPFYSYSTPPMLKRWLDDVLSYGWAYGSKGQRLRNKPLQLVISSGAPASAYAATGYNRFTMEELLRPLAATAHLTGMVLQPPLILHGVPNIPGLDVTDLQMEKVMTFAASYRKTLQSGHSCVRGI